MRAVTLTEADHVALGRGGAKTLLFRPEEPSAAARAYIAHGEALGVPDAYKCRARTPWWKTPLPAPPDLFFTYMNQGTPQLAENPARLHYLNSVHGLYLASGAAELAELLALASLNSATALSAEITGRAYGGGILKMEPREAAQLLVPSVDTVHAHRHPLTQMLPDVKRLLRAGRLSEARTLVDRTVLSARVVAPASLEAIRDGHAILSGRRHERARSRTHAGGRNDHPR